MSELALLRPQWRVPPQIHAATTLRNGGDVGVSAPPFDRFNLGERCGDDPEAVARNRVQLRAIAGLPSEPRWLHQVHGTRVLRQSDLLSPAGESGADSAPEADAAVTSVAGVVLAVLSADCLPVLFCAADGSEVGAAHAGWRGLAAGVLESTVAAMGTPPRELIAWLGPAAARNAYEIGAEVRDAFLEHDARAASAFLPTRAGHWLVDLYALARQRLIDVGVTHVFGGDRCTISEPEHFYSHRRDGRCGRMASLIWIANP